MKRFLKVCVCLAFAGILAAPVLADPIDLSSWSAYTYNLLGGQPEGNWVLSNNNETVTQTLNADPSIYLNNLSQTSYKMTGSWRVNTTIDDDYMGFVFGYQNTSNFYIMDWKQLAQSLNPYGSAQEGFSIKKISANNQSTLTLADFWSSTGDTNSTILASSFGSDKGWADNTDYDFLLDFNPGEFSIQVSQGATTLWDVTVNDSSFEYGQFGFYNFSQQSVQYSGFEQTGGEIIDPDPAPVPEPGTLLLLGSGLAGLALYRRRMNKA